MRVLYRIVRSNPPTAWDFTSNEAKGRVPRRPLRAHERRLWRGLSVFDTLDSARAAAQQTPTLGDFIAEIAIPSNDESILIEQTGRIGHYTVWGSPARVLRYVRQVVAVVE